MGMFAWVRKRLVHHLSRQLDTHPLDQVAHRNRIAFFVGRGLQRNVDGGTGREPKSEIGNGRVAIGFSQHRRVHGGFEGIDANDPAERGCSFRGLVIGRQAKGQVHAFHR